jgi:hypothetical protein
MSLPPSKMNYNTVKASRTEFHSPQHLDHGVFLLRRQGRPSIEFRLSQPTASPWPHPPLLLHPPRGSNSLKCCQRSANRPSLHAQRSIHHQIIVILFLENPNLRHPHSLHHLPPPQRLLLPDVTFKKKSTGGVRFSSTVPLTKLRDREFQFGAHVYLVLLSLSASNILYPIKPEKLATQIMRE